MRDELEAQDYLTTLVELDPERDRPVITGPMVDPCRLHETMRRSSRQ